MLVRKMRLQRSWSQETLAEVSGLSVRTIQRIERGAPPSLESRAALAAAFDVDAAVFVKESAMPNTTPTLTHEEAAALEYVRDVKGFYSHAIVYAVANAITFGIWLYSGSSYPWFLWQLLGWGAGLAAHGVSVFEVFSFFGPKWEQRQVERRLGRPSTD